MGKNILSFLVVGAGAIGGITAALMKKDGCDVEIVCNYDDYATLIADHGIEAKKRGTSINNFNDPLFDRFNN